VQTKNDQLCESCHASDMHVGDAKASQKKKASLIFVNKLARQNI